MRERGKDKQQRVKGGEEEEIMGGRMRACD